MPRPRLADPRYVIRDDGTRARSPECRAWERIWNRCTNPNYKSFRRYGGRGIKVCERWRSFDAFFVDMGARPSPHHSIDRINNDGDYEPANCRWASPIEQQSNKSTNRLLTWNGETHTQAEWARRSGLPVTIIRARLREGWSVERTLGQPRYQYATPNVRLLELGGETLSITGWARRYGLSPRMLCKRINAGEALASALVRPKTPGKPVGRKA